MLEDEKQKTDIVKNEEDDGVDDAGTLSYSEVASNENENIYPVTNIKIDRVQFSIFELKRRYDRGSICLDPDFQRNAVWNSKQKSELIESVVMGIPLPLIYFAETGTGELVIVDGRQRLTTFFDFLDNKFSMNGLKIIPELNSCKFCDLEKDERKRKYAAEIEDFQLVIQIIKYPTPDRVRFDIFDRVNRGGTPLNNQEMRNALYQGEATRFLNQLAEDAKFKKATGNSISPLHMKDKYIILRAISFYMWKRGMLTKKNNEVVNYRSDIEEFLGFSMEYLNRVQASVRDELYTIFTNTMEMSYMVLGENAFRIPSDSIRRRPVSMTLFESLFYFISLFIEGENIFSEETIVMGVDELLENSIYLRALTYNVDSAVHVEQRFQIVEDLYREKCNDAK